jgi:hypothetical protein
VAAVAGVGRLFSLGNQCVFLAKSSTNSGNDKPTNGDPDSRKRACQKRYFRNFADATPQAWVQTISGLAHAVFPKAGCAKCARLR